MDLSPYPPYSTITVIRGAETMNVNVQEYTPADGDTIVMVLRPEEREAIQQERS